MKKINLITGNLGKLKELKLLIPDLVHKDIDINELQSFDGEEVVKDKAKKAFDIVKEPIIVDDASLYLECLNGFPGPFLKFFYEQLTNLGIYNLVNNYDNNKGKAVVLMCYYDGKDFVIGKGEIECKVVSPRGTNGHGVDPIIEVEGKTLSEMSTEEKNKVSYRYLASVDLINKLKDKGIIVK